MIDCEPLEDPANGSVLVGNTSLNGVARYSCDAGFELNGAEQLICTVNGTWSDTPPDCAREWMTDVNCA